jgi:transposase InsO family protein
MIGPLLTAPGGFNRVLVAIDKFTKWIEVKPVTCPKADRVLDFLDELVHRYRLPHRIITNLGSNFNNHQFREYCENSGIDIRHVSVAHPRANGQVECANGMVLDALKKRLHDAANTKGGKWIKEPQCTLGAAYSTHQVDGTVTLFPGLRLRCYPTGRRHMRFADSGAIRRRHI